MIEGILNDYLGQMSCREKEVASKVRGKALEVYEENKKAGKDVLTLRDNVTKSTAYIIIEPKEGKNTNLDPNVDLTITISWWSKPREGLSDDSITPDLIDIYTLSPGEVIKESTIMDKGEVSEFERAFSNAEELAEYRKILRERRKKQAYPPDRNDLSGLLLKLSSIITPPKILMNTRGII